MTKNTSASSTRNTRRVPSAPSSLGAVAPGKAPVPPLPTTTDQPASRTSPCPPDPRILTNCPSFRCRNHRQTWIRKSTACPTTSTAMGPRSLWILDANIWSASRVRRRPRSIRLCPPLLPKPHSRIRLCSPCPILLPTPHPRQLPLRRNHHPSRSHHLSTSRRLRSSLSTTLSQR